MGSIFIKLSILLTACLALFAGGDLIAQEDTPTYVWLRAEGGERNEHLFFRRDFSLATAPEKAELHLYADARYALYVNGAYVNFGPARSYHANPYYDTYDLRPYLREGENTLAVHALSNGMVTYQLFDYHGAFAAWGEILAGGSRIDLEVTKGWKCQPSYGYDQTAPRFSFATGAMEIWDSRGEASWTQPGLDTRAWKQPVPIATPERYGILRPRPIPPLTQEETTAVKVLGAYPLLDQEFLLSFRVPTPDTTPQVYNESHRAIGMTWIYAPEAMEVTAGLWWGDFYLNGERLSPLDEQPTPHYRRDYPLRLRAGWNAFVMRYGIIWGSWDFYLALPKDRGLVLSPERKREDDHWFTTLGPFGLAGNAELDEIDLTAPPEKIRAVGGDRWRWHDRNVDAGQPARDLAWKAADRNQRLELPRDGRGHLVIPPRPGGVVLDLAMAEITLGRLFVEGDFPEGTQIDVGFSEELNVNGAPWLYKRYQIGAAMRFVTSTDRRRYESFKPYGAKYLTIHFSGYEDTLLLQKVGMVRQQYPFETVGAFRCSNPVFDRIWEAGWRTLQLCAEDSYTDTPFRERGLYAGDMLPEAAITAAVSGDLRLAEHSLRVFQDMYREEMLNGKENRHNDFPLITLLTMDYVARYTDNWSLAEAYYDNYASLLRHHLNKKLSNDLIPASRVFIEWTDLNKGEAAMTAYQALIVRSLAVMSQWAERFDKQDDLAFFRTLSFTMGEVVNEILQDEETRLYYDGWQADTLITNRQKLTSTIWPALYGLTPNQDIPRILDWLEEELRDIGDRNRKRKITPYSSFYLFSLLYREERPDIAEAFLLKYWSPMALHSSAPTVWENFDIGGQQGTSSHAWSGHPTYFLATETLGVNLGWQHPLFKQSIVIAPQSATLSWAEGRVAHPKGPVFVRWEIRGDQLWLWYDAPEGVPVTVQPRGRLGKLALVLNP
jgi:alpha-L-rhamnosidase